MGTRRVQVPVGMILAMLAAFVCVALAKSAFGPNTAVGSTSAAPLRRRNHHLDDRQDGELQNDSHHRHREHELRRRHRQLAEEDHAAEGASGGGPMPPSSRTPPEKQPLTRRSMSTETGARTAQRRSVATADNKNALLEKGRPPRAAGAAVGAGGEIGRFSLGKETVAELEGSRGNWVISASPEQEGAINTLNDGTAARGAAAASRKETIEDVQVVARERGEDEEGAVTTPIVLTARNGRTLNQLDLAYSNRTHFRHNGDCPGGYTRQGDRASSLGNRVASHHQISTDLSDTSPAGGASAGSDNKEEATTSTSSSIITTSGKHGGGGTYCGYYGYPYHHPPPYHTPTIGYGWASSVTPSRFFASEKHCTFLQVTRIQKLPCEHILFDHWLI